MMKVKRTGIIRGIRAKASSVSSLVLFSLFVKPKEKTTPRYYQDKYEPVHPLVTGYVNQESESKRTKHPSHEIPHIYPSFSEFVCNYRFGQISLSTKIKEVNYA